MSFQFFGHFDLHSFLLVELPDVRDLPNLFLQSLANNCLTGTDIIEAQAFFLAGSLTVSPFSALTDTTPVFGSMAMVMPLASPEPTRRLLRRSPYPSILLRRNNSGHLFGWKYFEDFQRGTNLVTRGKIAFHAVANTDR